MTTIALWILRKYKFGKFTVWVAGACMNHGNMPASFVPSFQLFTSNKFRLNSCSLLHQCQPFLLNPVNAYFVAELFRKPTRNNFRPNLYVESIYNLKSRVNISCSSFYFKS